MPRAIHLFLAEEEGNNAIEYGLIAALIFLVIITGVGAFADATVALWTNISNHVN